MADDIAALVRHLGIGRVDVMGYSLGGGLRDGGWDGSGRPNAQLAILPGVTHCSIFADPLLAVVATRFLD